MKSLLRVSLLTLVLLSPFAHANGSKDPPPNPASSNWIQWVMQVVEG